MQGRRIVQAQALDPKPKPLAKKAWAPGLVLHARQAVTLVQCKYGTVTTTGASTGFAHL